MNAFQMGVGCTPPLRLIFGVLQLCSFVLLVLVAGSSKAQEAKSAKFRAIIAIPTLYEGVFAPLPNSIKALPHLESAMRALARRGGFKDHDITIQVHTDAPGHSSLKSALEADIVDSIFDSAAAALAALAFSVLMYRLVTS